MKKTIAILLVAVLAAGSVFAGISGEGKIAYGYDLDSKNTGFTNSTNLKVNVDLATASEEKQAEGAIYAAVKGDLTLKLYNGAKGDSTDDPMAWGGNTGLDFIAISNVSATINGADWSVDILNSGKQLDLAKSAIDSSTKHKQLDSYGKKLGDKTDATTYKVGFNAAPGFTVTYKGYSVGLGFQYKDADSTDKLNKDFDEKKYSTGDMVKYYKGTDFSLVAKTPEIAVTDEIKVQAGASFYNNETASVTIGTKSDAWKTVFDKYKTNRGSAIGGSVAVSYANDTMSAKVAADLGYAIKAYKIKANEVLDADDKLVSSTVEKIVEDKNAEKFGMDLAANFTMDPVSVDAYYKYDGTQKDAVNANYLSLQVKTDLNAFDVPVVLAVYGTDLFRFKPTASASGKLSSSATFGLKADVTAMEGLTINTEASITPFMVPSDAPDVMKFIGWSAKAGAKYDADLFTVEGGLKLSNAGLNARLVTGDTYKQLVNKVVLSANAKVSSATLVPGATLALEYSADDLLNSLNADYKKANELTTYGSVTASCKVAF